MQTTMSPQLHIGKSSIAFIKVFISICNISWAAKSLQSCPTLCDPIDGSPPGSPVPGIFQARVLEWGAIAFSERKLSTEELMLG